MDRQASFRKRVTELTREGSRPENIAIILDAEVEEVKEVQAEFSKENTVKDLGQTKTQIREARNIEIRKEYSAGKKAIELAAKHNLGEAAIYRICQGLSKRKKRKPKPEPSSAGTASPSFEGTFDHVEIYDKKLSKEEIGTMTGKPKPGLMPIQDEINKLIIGELSPICIEHDLQPRYNVGSKLFGSVNNGNVSEALPAAR